MSTLETNLIQPSTGTTLTLGASGDTITIPSGATITNSGTASGFGGITEADQWRLTANTNDGTNDVVSANWERNDSTGYTKIGTGVSESSGIFSFATTGIYFINLNTHFRLVGGDYAYCDIQVTTNNSSYTAVSRSTAVNLTGSDEEGFSGIAHYILDVTDTSNVKIRLVTGSMANNSRLKGSSSLNLTSLTFIRLGDT
jgi:hypothetical protein